MSEKLSNAAAMREAAAKVLIDRIDVCFGTVDKHNGVGQIALNASAFGAELAELVGLIRSLPLPPDTRDGEIAELRRRNEELQR
jgi:hypothetical protein